MYVQNASRWSKYSTPQAWVGTLCLALLAFLIRHSVTPWIQPFGIFHFFILSCLLTQFFFGYRYALLGLGLSIFLGEFFFVEPYASFTELTSKDVIISVNFATVTLAAIALMENLQRSAYARELLLKVSESRYWISLQRENDRLHFARQSSQTWSMLALLIEDFDRIFLLQYDENTVRLGAGFRRLTEGHSDALTTENWLSAIAPEDRPVLLDSMRPDPGPNAQKPTTLSLQMYGRGSLQARPLTVHVMRFMFMNKPLVIVLTDSPQIQTNLTV